MLCTRCSKRRYFLRNFNTFDNLVEILDDTVDTNNLTITEFWNIQKDNVISVIDSYIE